MYPMHLRCKHLCPLPLNTEGTYMVCSNWLLTLRNVILLDINLKPSPYPSSHLWAISFCLWNENKVQKSHLLIFMKEHMLHFEEVQKIFLCWWMDREEEFLFFTLLCHEIFWWEASKSSPYADKGSLSNISRKGALCLREIQVLHSSGGPTVTQKAQAFYRSRKESRK